LPCLPREIPWTDMRKAWSTCHCHCLCPQGSSEQPLMQCPDMEVHWTTRSGIRSGCLQHISDTGPCSRTSSYPLRLMYIPLFSESRSRRRLERRKGGGGGKGSGGGGKGSGGKGGKGGSSKNSGGSGGKKSKAPIPGGSSSLGKSSATAYGYGGGKPIIIPAGQPFAGRSAGGATRDQVFGTKYV